MSDKVTDQTPLPWGEHKGIPMADVPPEYLLWLLKQPWIRDWPDIRNYLLQRQTELRGIENRDAPQSTDGFTSLDDYYRFGRD